MNAQSRTPSPEAADHLLAPSVEADAGRGVTTRAPWRLGSLGYVAFFGGPLAAGTLSYLNLHRLGIAEQRARLAVILSAAAGFVLVMAVAVAIGEQDSTLNVALRAVGLLAFAPMYLIQRTADRAHHYYAGEEAYASLWVPGLLATIVFGGAQAVLAISMVGGTL